MALHSDGARRFEPLREFEPEAVEDVLQGLLGSYNASQSELAAIVGRQHDVRALDRAQLIQDRPRAVAEPRASLPRLERFPEDVREEAHEHMCFHALRLLMPHGTDGQVTLVDPESASASVSWM